MGEDEIHQYQPPLSGEEVEDRLRLCSLEARGLWLEMIWNMRKTKARSKINYFNPADISKRTRQEIIKLLRELEETGIVMCDQIGRFYLQHRVEGCCELFFERSRGEQNSKVKNQSTFLTALIDSEVGELTQMLRDTSRLY